MATLADLQAERERLRADNAKADYEAALAATLSGPAVVAAGHAARRVVLDALEALASRCVEAISGEGDETRVHYLLSEVAHEWLTAVGEGVARETGAVSDLGERFRNGVRPRDLLTVSQWAERHRELKSGTNAPGPWHNALTPYLVEIMDCLSEHSAVRTVVFSKSSGVGGTEVLFNWIGYIMHHLGNKDLLCVLPTLELRDRSFNPRLAKMIDESPVLAGIVSSARRDKANRADVMEYGARARIIKAGGNSPDSLRSDHLPYVICDEVDAFAWDVGGEGDPMTLIENRQRTFSRAKTYLVSTPTHEGRSRITQQYDRSDQRRYFVPCPHCGEFQPLEWGGRNAPYGLKFARAQQHDGETGPAPVSRAWYVCRECACEIEEIHKTDMLAKGRWIAARPHIRHYRGYHINALYAPVGLGLSWLKVAQKWVDAQGDTAELKAFANTYLGEVFSEQGEEIPTAALLTRLEVYVVEQLPIGLITAGVDVQKDRLEVSIVGWGAGEEGWLLEHVVIPGDTTHPATWDDLDDVLIGAGVQIAAIDTGYNTSAVYAFCDPRTWCVPIKGMDGRRPLVEDRETRNLRLRRRQQKGRLRMELIGIDDAKALIAARLKLEKPGPGYLHFPQRAVFDDEYFQQLGAEKLVAEIKSFKITHVWKKTRARNEALDCLVYALAALRLADRDPAPVLPPANHDARHTARRVTQSSYLTR